MGKKRGLEHELKEAYATILARRADERRAACPAPDTLLAIVENTIGQARRLELLDHVAGCGACLREFRLLQSIAEGRRALD
ncbi:MAG: hypothetical protein GWN99_13250 [Gemmatimonadetes bacterium]|uniref:Zinc-finger domain-containing protein n=1 Tax=Candidatus Kutchimonas denitrificans TaxID=3056748 RepID=A0AAE4ZBG3_9BACT|nr:hypothetical protein [Gemmatimonadota bacterium]NIR75846.1 hypothetical protein [Candidatus Kutchimonas denitrificans]NIS02013.1 hypothetical protein [Gemmatimonadota bacterium]NIT67817.1 hypothetical protein [Gemmatimonadota bacterium]NIU53804.1 hypothetical protein [Gemmatimonadota bacterium]